MDVWVKRAQTKRSSKSKVPEAEECQTDLESSLQASVAGSERREEIIGNKRRGSQCSTDSQAIVTAGFNVMVS